MKFEKLLANAKGANTEWLYFASKTGGRYREVKLPPMGEIRRPLDIPHGPNPRTHANSREEHIKIAKKALEEWAAKKNA